MNAVSLTDVSVFFGQVRGLDNVSFTIEAGERVGLVGESGSGKSTLCRLLVGLRAATTGEVRIFDGSITDQLKTDSSRFRRTVQLVMQDAVASLSPRMRIRDLLAEVIKVHALPAEEGWAWIETLVDRLGLSVSILDRYPHEISGGQARRIAILRALSLKPRILVADEPTAGLDVSVQGGLLNLLIDIQKELSLTWLLISHDLRVIRRVTSRVLVMYLGQVVEESDTEGLFRTPAHPYSTALLSADASNGLDRPGRPIVLQGEIPSPVNPPAGCRFHTRCPVAQAQCRTEMPRLRQLDAKRRVRCHYPYSLPFDQAVHSPQSSPRETSP